MNSGAYRVSERFGGFDVAKRLYDKLGQSDFVPTHPDGPYKSDGWRVAKLIDKGQPTALFERYPEARELLEMFKCRTDVMVFYSMLPGAAIHPHRDVSGTLEFGRLRFHVPIVTNPDVDFFVSKKKVPMRTGELWALNTSYLHAVENRSQQDRIHLVLEVDANDWCWAQLPKRDLRYYSHYAYFMSLCFANSAKAVVANPAKLKAYGPMIKFVLDRFLKRGAES